MQLKAQMWGNSLAVRLPRSLAEDARINANDVLEARVTRGKLVIERKKQPTLDEMLAQVPADYRETEVDWGKPVGKEVW